MNKLGGSKRKTTWEDVRLDNCEKEKFVASDGYHEHGKSTIFITCPYCFDKVETFRWSLCGSGKRCNCGALFGSNGIAYKRKKTKLNTSKGEP